MSLIKGFILIFSFILFVLTVFIVIPPYFKYGWQFSLGITEWSLWLGILAFITLLVSLVLLYFQINSSTFPRSHLIIIISSIFCLCSIIFSLLPVITSYKIAKDKNIPLSLKTYFLGENIPQINPQTIEFSKTNGIALNLDIYTNNQDANVRKPALIVIHGGSWAGGKRSDFPQWNNWFVKRGFIVFDIDYTLSPQPNWNEATSDVRKAISWVTSNAEKYNIDLNNINLFGRSAGGHLALTAGYDRATDSNNFPNSNLTSLKLNSVVSLYAPTDLVWGYNNPSHSFVNDSSRTLERFIGGSLQEKEDIYKKMSPVYHVSQNSPKTFVAIGKDDLLVSPKHSEFLEKKLKENTIEHTSMIIPFAQHGFDYNFNGYHSQILRGELTRFWNIS